MIGDQQGWDLPRAVRALRPAAEPDGRHRKIELKSGVERGSD
jgi:hypothetical protein